MIKIKITHTHLGIFTEVLSDNNKICDEPSCENKAVGSYGTKDWQNIGCYYHMSLVEDFLNAHIKPKIQIVEGDTI